jgi:hypothetical protein
MVWHLEELGELVRQKHGESQNRFIKPLLNSVGRKYDIARYHASESRRLVDQHFTADKLENYTKAVSMIFDRIDGKEDAVNFYYDVFSAEAHIGAYAQVLHSIFDIVGQVIILAFDLSGTFSPKQNIYLYTVKDKLKEVQLAPLVVVEIETALSQEAFQYLSAFVNTNKHRCLVKIPHTVMSNAQEDISHGLKIQSFSFKGKVFPEKWGKQFVGEDFKILAEWLVRIGRAINETLASEKSESG